jgi:hypothetical protein
MISQNFCQTLRGGDFVDNLSCPEEPVERGECLRRRDLCNFIFDCLDREDEGRTPALSRLICGKKLYNHWLKYPPQAGSTA